MTPVHYEAPNPDAVTLREHGDEFGCIWGDDCQYELPNGCPRCRQDYRVRHLQAWAADQPAANYVNVQVPLPWVWSPDDLPKLLAEHVQAFVTQLAPHYDLSPQEALDALRRGLTRC